jgi:3'(2'), 5'-bisphosphate nucleotidase
MTAAASRGLLDPLVAIARRAAGAILAIYEAGATAVTTKADATPLTEADLAAHRLIVAALAELTPGTPVLSEESAETPFAERRAWARYWLVDPLDGTREFLSRNGEFTVNIALIEGHAPALGVVHVPVTGVSYFGAVGQGAWRQSAAQAPQSIRVAERSASPLRVAGSRSHRGASLDSFLARVGEHELLEMGSSLKFCLVAEGAADVYPRLGPTCEWDTAAAHAVLGAAGGTVLDLDGAPLQYNTRPEVKNPFFVAYGPRDYDWVTLLR